MKTIDATVTSEGQITIPVEIRRKLGLAKGSTVRFVIDDDAVTLMVPRFTMEDVFGSVPPIPGISIDFDDEIDEAMNESSAETYSWVRQQP